MANEHTRLNDIEFHKYMCEVEEWFLNGSPKCEGYWAMIQSTINGYHAYKVKPPIEVLLPCTREPDNPYDEKAVVCKGLDGEVIGHVPKELASLFSYFLDESKADRIVALYTGRMANEGAVARGGVKLGCIYMIHAADIEQAFRLSNLMNQYIPRARADVFLDTFSHIDWFGNMF